MEEGKKIKALDGTRAKTVQSEEMILIFRPLLQCTKKIVLSKI